MKKRAISVLLCVLLVFTCLSIQTTEVSAATRTKISSVTLGKSSVAYTGKAITQSKIVVKAKVGGKTKTLKKGTDYTVSYKNNKNVGTATVTVKGKGNYTGTITKKFKITAVKISSVKLKKTSVTYTGKAITQADAVVKAKVGGSTKTLKKGTDYTISYKNNTNAGTATVTVKGKGNFKGTISKTFTIEPASLSSVTLEESAFDYTGSAIKPAVVVRAKVNGSTKILKKGTDYTVSYKNNVEPGIATVTVTGKGNYTGKKSQLFTIYYPDPGDPADLDELGRVIDPTTEWGEYDALISQIRSETNSAIRTDLMHQAEDLLMSTYAVIPLYYYNDVYMQKDYVQGIYSNAYGTKFFMYTEMMNGSDTLRLNLASDPFYMDPVLNSTVDGACLAANCFSGLYTYNSDGLPVPACAENYQVSADGLTYTVNLKPGLKWSDGTDLTAEDFEYSWKRAADPATGADYRFMFAGFDGYDTEEGINVTAVNANTLVFVLSAPCAYMEDLMAFPTFYPVQKAWVEANAVEGDPGAWSTAAGFPSNGAYVCTGWIPDISMTFEKNPYFWDAGNVITEKLEFMLSSDDAAVYDEYNAGNLDFIDSVPTDELTSLIDSQNMEIHSVNELGTYYISFNVKSPLFDGMTPAQAVAVRKAISMLIDREFIIRSICMGGQMAATSFVPVGMADGNGGIFHQSNQDGYYDAYAITNDRAGTMNKAWQLLKAAGFQFDKETGRLSEETPLAIEYLTNASSAHMAIAEAIQADLSVVGINLSVSTVSWSIFLEDRSNGNFDMAREGWIADFNDPINMLEMFMTDSGNNDPQFGR